MTPTTKQCCELGPDGNMWNEHGVCVRHVPKGEEKCIWCGETYEEHKDQLDPLFNVKTPCGGVKHLFCVKEPDEIGNHQHCQCGVVRKTPARIEAFIQEAETRVVERIRDDVVKIINESKATFFVQKGQEVEVPTDEALYELKAEISNNVERYFYELKPKKE